MIIKTLSRHSRIKQAIQYLFKDESKLIDDIHNKLIIRKNIRTKSIDKWIDEFEQNEKNRKYKSKVSTVVYHHIISFGDIDRNLITEKVIKDVTNKFIEMRGIDSLYLATPHFDQQHIHIHIINSGSKLVSGLANRQTKQEFKNLKLAMDVYQRIRYPELINSLPEHNKTKGGRDSSFNPKIRDSKKLLLVETLDRAYTKATSLTGFLEAINKSGYSLYYRNKVLTGIQTDEKMKFRFTRLGFDTKKLQTLGMKEKHKNELSQLSILRQKAVIKTLAFDTKARGIKNKQNNEIDTNYGYDR